MSTRVPMIPIKIHDNSIFAKPERYPGFERWWRRVIVAVELIVTFNIICGLLGLFGTGPLSTTRETIASPPRLDRLSAHHAAVGPVGDHHPCRRTSIEPQPGGLVAAGLRGRVRVVATSPPARDIHAEKDGNVYAFDFGLSRQGEARISIKPRGAAYVNAPMRVGDGTAPLWQVVLP